MRKIPTLFLRDYKLKCTPVTEEPNPECDWVFRGDGIATRKMDGINIKIHDERAFIRIKPLERDYCEAAYEPFLHGHYDKYVAQAIGQTKQGGIYEAYGQGIRGDAEKVEGQHLVRILPVDRSLVIHGIKRTYRDLMGYFATHDIEGIVFHHPDGRMAKIKTRDFYHLTRP